MKLFVTACFIVFLGGCSSPSFVGDARPVPVTSSTPDHFELPARFALARVVYGRTQAAGAEEAELWTELANRAESLGSFATLVAGDANYRYSNRNSLVHTAREQRYTYLLLVRMYPATGSADIALLHTGSGGVMATARAVSPNGGQRGFWGGQIRNPSRLERATLNIAKATVPVVEEMLRGVSTRQRKPT